MNDKKRDFLRTLAVATKGVAGLMIWNGLFIGMATNAAFRDAALVCALVFTSVGMMISGSANPLKLGEDVCNLIGESCADVAKSFRDAYKMTRDKVADMYGKQNAKTK